MRRFMEDKSPENSKQTENKFQLENVDFELLNKQGNEWKHENTATEIRSTSDGIYKWVPLTIKWIMDCWTCKFHPHHQPQCQWWQQEITLHNARSIASFKYFHIPKKTLNIQISNCSIIINFAADLSSTKLIMWTWANTETWKIGAIELKISRYIHCRFYKDNVSSVHIVQIVDVVQCSIGVWSRST